MLSEPAQKSSPVPPITLVDTQFSGICICQRKGIIIRRATLGPISMISREFGRHYPACPYHGYSTRTYVRTQYAVMIKQATEDRYLSCFWKAFDAATSFLPQVLVPVRVFRGYEKDCPGFRHISRARSSLAFSSLLHPTHRENVHEVLQDLLFELRNGFSKTREWEGVHLDDGETLLHVSRLKSPSTILYSTSLYICIYGLP